MTLDRLAEILSACGSSNVWGNTMKKILLSAAAVALISGQAFAGGMAEPMMEPEVIVEEAASSSGGFILPLILLALVALALANNNDSETVSAE